jgi:hypothetical protein
MWNNSPIKAETKHLSPTLHKGARVKAKVSFENSQKTMITSFDYELTPWKNHQNVLNQLLEKMGISDSAVIDITPNETGWCWLLRPVGLPLKSFENQP